MGREISIFSDYHQRENSLTNYCGLLMKLVYEESPKKFQELLASLLNTDDNIIIGPTFTQQTRMENSVPDLLITQKSFSIFFETKITDWFYSEQIRNHLSNLNTSSNSKIDSKILFLLSNFETDDLNNRFNDDIIKAEADKITLQPLTFEDFVGSLEQVCTSEYLKNLLEEFKIYLDRNSLLPKWKYLLDVVNCSGSMHEIEQGVYICPDIGGAYSHRRAKYFGSYARRKVSDIFEIKAIVIIEKGQTAQRIKWKNDNTDDRNLIDQALKTLNNLDSRLNENKDVALQIFLLDKRENTNFIKETSGGMQQSKKYFWNIAKDCQNSKDLAEKLNNREWGEFENR